MAESTECSYLSGQLLGTVNVNGLPLAFPASRSVQEIARFISTASREEMSQLSDDAVLRTMLHNLDSQDRLKLLQTRVPTETNSNLKDYLIWRILSPKSYSLTEFRIRANSLIRLLPESDWASLCKLIDCNGHNILHKLMRLPALYSYYDNSAQCVQSRSNFYNPSVQCVECMNCIVERLELDDRDFSGASPFSNLFTRYPITAPVIIRAVDALLDNPAAKLAFFRSPCSSSGGTIIHFAMENVSHTTGESLDDWSNLPLDCILQSIKDPKAKTAFLSCRDNNGRTPLHQIRNSYFLNHIFQDIDENERCKLLTMQDRYGTTPLHIMACTDALCHTVSPSMFLKVVSIKDYNGLPALHSLATMGFEPFMRWLARIRQVLSADMLCMKDDDGQSIIHNQLLGLRQSRTQTYPSELINLGSSLFDMDWPSTSEIADKLLNILKVLDNKKERLKVLNDKNPNSFSTLHLVSVTLPEYVGQILEVLDTDDIPKALSVATTGGDTIIHTLCRYRPLTVLQALTNVRAVDLAELLIKQNMDGNTPVHMLIHHQPSEILGELLSRLNPCAIRPLKVLEVKNKQDATAFHLACALQSTEVIDKMVDILGNAAALTCFDDSKTWIDVVDAIRSLCDTSEEQETIRGVIRSFSVLGRPGIPLVLRNDGRSDLQSLVQEIADSEIQSEVQIINSLPTEELKKDIPRLTESLKLAHGNTILHCLAERDDTETMIKLLDAMGISKRENMLSTKNFGDLTTLDLARSYEFRQLIEWSRAQEGFYYLPTPPSVLIMYTTTNREGANKEKEALMQTFPVFNVEIEVKENPNESEMLGAIRDTQQHQPNMSALIVIIMSHGSSGAVCAGDGRDVKIQDILLQMCSPSLEGKPKVLLIQACQSRVSDPQQTNAPEAPVDPRPAASQLRISQFTPSALQNFAIPSRDVITMVATVNGGVAYRNQMIPMFAEELRNSKHEGDIYEIFLRTHYRFSMRYLNQIPEFCSTLTQKLSLKNIFKSQP